MDVDKDTRPSATNGMAVDEKSVDDSLYSRQLYVMGHAGQLRLQTANVLIIGLKGLGVEIAKNVILAGAKSVTLYDPAPTELRDLGSQFYLNEGDAARSVPRDQASASHLASLNPYVKVLVSNEKFPNKNQYQAVVATEVSREEQIAMGKYCHEHGIKFIAADIHGLMGFCFVDVGEKHTIDDPMGEQPVRGLVTHISNGNPGIVTVQDERRHGLETGDWVVFEEVLGMTELNHSDKPRQVKVLTPYSFSIEDTTNYGQYKGEGHFQQVLVPKEIRHDTMTQALKEVQTHIVYDVFGHSLPLFCLHQALHTFREQHGRLPIPTSASETAAVVEFANQVATGMNLKLDVDFVAGLARCAAASISPMAALFGGYVGQEVVKAVSGKFTPLNQLFFFDAYDALPPKDIDLNEFAPLGSRYDDQIAIFGRSVHQKVASLNTFVVGAGAIGCELLKNLALMGAATEGNGRIAVTDMDTIEKSNLNRQFLFRSNDVGKLKSETAAKAAKVMNPALRIVAQAEKVGAASENLYNDDFWSSLDVALTALDNVDARLYVDQRCIFFQKPMIDSGTLGTKGNTQVVVPFLTESYGSSRDPPEESIPICTLKNFPHKIEHTIQWARDLLEGSFRQNAEDVNNYLTDPNWLNEIAKQPNTQLDSLRNVQNSLVNEKPLTFDECIAWARLQFESEFGHRILQMLHTFPEDSVTSSGAKFWSGVKRAPQALVFDAHDPTHLGFIIAAANLRAFNFGLRGEKNHDYFIKVLSGVKVPPFQPKQVKIAADEAEAKKLAEEAAKEDDHDVKVKTILSTLPKPESLAGYRLNPVIFEKDDDTNFHMAFITATSNLRARNYRIKEVTQHETKFIAGKIIPAIATTTAAVTGLVCIELYKILQKKPLEAYRNTFINLALPLVTGSEPIAPTYQKVVLKDRGEWKWSLWDRLEIELGDCTMEELIAHFQSKLGLGVSMVSFGQSMLYFDFNKKKNPERLKMPLTKLIQEVAKVTVPPTDRFVLLEVCVTADDDDVDVPTVRLRLR